MTKAMTAQCEKESHWIRLIDLEGDTKLTLQNQSAVKGQKLGLLLFENLSSVETYHLFKRKKT